MDRAPGTPDVVWPVLEEVARAQEHRGHLCTHFLGTLKRLEREDDSRAESPRTRGVCEAEQSRRHPGGGDRWSSRMYKDRRKLEKQRRSAPQGRAPAPGLSHIRAGILGQAAAVPRFHICRVGRRAAVLPQGIRQVRQRAPQQHPHLVRAGNRLAAS